MGSGEAERAAGAGLPECLVSVPRKSRGAEVWGASEEAVEQKDTSGQELTCQKGKFALPQCQNHFFKRWRPGVKRRRKEGTAQQSAEKGQVLPDLH